MSKLEKVNETSPDFDSIDQIHNEICSSFKCRLKSRVERTEERELDRVRQPLTVFERAQSGEEGALRLQKGSRVLLRLHVDGATCPWHLHFHG